MTSWANDGQLWWQNWEGERKAEVHSGPEGARCDTRYVGVNTVYVPLVRVF